jgi:hypothetical protein
MRPMPKLARDYFEAAKTAVDTTKSAKQAIRIQVASAADYVSRDSN